MLIILLTTYVISYSVFYLSVKHITTEFHKSVDNALAELTTGRY